MKTYSITRKVEENMLAVNVKSGSLRVLATPVVVAIMEEASSKFADTILEDGLTTVGTKIEIEHISPTPFGGEIFVESTIVRNDGRFFEFEVTASDNMGVIARGKHNRVAVNSEKFQMKADDKLV